jgi:dihydroorotase
VEPGHLTLERAVALMTYEAARICSLDAGRLDEGGLADIAIFDPKAEWTVRAEDFRSRSRNSPFLGHTLRGKVKYTLCDGKVVYQD